MRANAWRNKLRSDLNWWSTRIVCLHPDGWCKSNEVGGSRVGPPHDGMDYDVPLPWPAGAAPMEDNPFAQNRRVAPARVYGGSDEEAARALGELSISRVLGLAVFSARNRMEVVSVYPGSGTVAVFQIHNLDNGGNQWKARMLDLLYSRTVVKACHRGVDFVRDLHAACGGRPNINAPAAIFDVQLAFAAVQGGWACSYDAVVRCMLQERAEVESDSIGMNADMWGSTTLHAGAQREAVQRTVHLPDLYIRLAGAMKQGTVQEKGGPPFIHHNLINEFNMLSQEFEHKRYLTMGILPRDRAQPSEAGPWHMEAWERTLLNNTERWRRDPRYGALPFVLP